MYCDIPFIRFDWNRLKLAPTQLIDTVYAQFAQGLKCDRALITVILTNWKPLDIVQDLSTLKFYWTFNAHIQ